MNINVNRKYRRIAVIEIEGEVDMMSAPDVRDTLVPLFLDTMRGVVVDLSKSHIWTAPASPQ